MGDILVKAKTQRIVVNSQQRIEVKDLVVSVINTPVSVVVVPAGPQGPPGVQGIQGPPGVDADTGVEVVMEAHVNSPEPHPVYDDMQNLTILLENGLF